MNSKNEFLDVDNIYCASFLALNQVQPELIPDFGSHITFRFPNDARVCRLITEFNVSNPPIGVRDFASAISKLRAQMIARKHQG